MHARAALVIVAISALTLSVEVQQGAPAAGGCQVAGNLVRVPELPEGSGVAASRRTPGRLWAHNDSGPAVLVALDTKGAVAGRVRVDGVKVEDWEAIAVGPCPAGSCIYIADIGDNDAKRSAVTIYRVPEPSAASGSVAAGDAIRVRYPDGAHDAETLLVTPKGDILIVTKGDTGHVALYRVPQNATLAETVTLQQVGKPRQAGKTAPDERITDGAVSPDGSLIALRTRTAIAFYRADALLGGDWREVRRVTLNALGEPQGEGLSFGDEQTIFLVGEGGKKSLPGTFARMTCPAS